MTQITLGQLHAALSKELEARPKRADWPVLVQLQWDGAYAKAYLTGAPQYVHDNLPAPDGSDDLDVPATFVAILQGDIEGEL